MRGRAIIIHNIGHARAALAAAKGQRIAVVLLSPPNAAGYIGATVFRDIIKQAAVEYPGVDFTIRLDCGNDPGLALGAMRQGIKRLKVSLKKDVKARIKDIARQYRATIDDSYAETLDLLYQADPVQACRSWLEKG